MSEPVLPVVSFSYSDNSITCTHEEPISANVAITIEGLPLFEAYANSAQGLSSYAFDQVNNCNLVRIVHRYKCLLTEGDVGGKRVYSRKRHHSQPLQNKSLRLPITYLVYLHPNHENHTLNLLINVFTNHGADSTVRENGVERTLSATELAHWTYMFGYACYKDVEIYLQDCWRKAQRNNTEPDYYGFKP